MIMRFSHAVLFSFVLVAGCSSASDGDDRGQGSTPAPAATPPDAERVALIRGALKDPATAGATHDAVAAQTKPVAQSLGDFGHYTAVGVADPTHSLSIDRWTTAEGATGLYDSPDFQKAAGGLFAAPPSIALFTHPDGWLAWGDVDYRKVNAKIFVTIRGRLAAADLETAKKAHNDAAGALEAAASARGDVAHVVLASVSDPHEVTFIDYWTNPEGPSAFYATPEARQAFGGIFAAAPEVEVFASTSWVQW